VSHDPAQSAYLANRILPLTERPTRGADIVPFDTPRPRTTATRCDPVVIRTKARTLEIFQRAVRK
jgi:NitT/TauT family transport system ATP-binding protein